MLKTAMQSQLDGVKTGLEQLQSALADMQMVTESVAEIEDTLKELPLLQDKLYDIKIETQKHSQLLTAKENLKHLFNVPEIVQQTETCIMEGRLLEAHKAMVDLENSRDDLLFELHKLPHQSSTDREVLKEYFEPLSSLSIQMEKQIRSVMQRSLNTVRKDPKVIVTALRIIEREEKSDEECLQRQKSTGFLPPDRPKRWKEKGLGAINTHVMERIEGNQLEIRCENKMWLVRHLEVIRMITCEDLRIVKSLFQPIFPPRYKIMDHFIQLYQKAMSSRLLEVIDAGLEGQEYVSILSWILQTYPGKEMMKNINLQIPANKILPLLDDDTMEKLQKEYLNNIQENYKNWMKNVLAQEVQDWKRREDPELDIDQCYHTSAPIIIYQMIDEHLQVAATISPDLVNKVLVLSIEEITSYGNLYQVEIHNYKNMFFNDRQSVHLFTRYMMAIVNNCDRYEELAQQLKEHWWKAGSHDGSAAAKFETLIRTFRVLRDESIGFLLDEAFMNITSHFQDILTPKWMSSSIQIDTICLTLDDFFGDYHFLKDKNFERVMSKAQDRFAVEYITSMFQPSLLGFLKGTFSPDENFDRRGAADKIIEEAKKAKDLFNKVAEDIANYDSPFDALALLAEVFKCDAELLSLELGTFVKKYPDVTFEQLYCLLHLRGDLSKTDARLMAQEVAPGGLNNKNPTTLHARSIFSQINLNNSGSIKEQIVQKIMMAE
eukprot:TRINITY_DN480_c0_g1_i1.p1 TRINITY_DN480_c0_g1~~TRINITY_DN480_c0_g1_i1.p1  ORF type:complete len:718 (-),score=192.62 TRINITY_DN480_c0_g1_i1:66-2219(-)